MAVQDDVSFLAKVAAANNCYEVALFTVTPPDKADVEQYRRSGDQFDAAGMQHAVAALQRIVLAVLPSGDDAAVEIVGFGSVGPAPFYAIVIFARQNGVPIRAGVLVKPFESPEAAQMALAGLQLQTKQFRDCVVH